MCWKLLANRKVDNHRKCFKIELKCNKKKKLKNFVRIVSTKFSE